MDVFFCCCCCFVSFFYFWSETIRLPLLSHERLINTIPHERKTRKKRRKKTFCICYKPAVRRFSCTKFFIPLRRRRGCLHFWFASPSTHWMRIICVTKWLGQCVECRFSICSPIKKCAAAATNVLNGFKMSFRHVFPPDLINMDRAHCVVCFWKDRRFCWRRILCLNINYLSLSLSHINFTTCLNAHWWWCWVPKGERTRSSKSTVVTVMVVGYGHCHYHRTQITFFVEPEKERERTREEVKYACAWQHMHDARCMRFYDFFCEISKNKGELEVFIEVM